MLILTFTKQTFKLNSRRVLRIGIAVWMGLLAGCGAPDLRPVPVKSPGTSMDMNGDWDDVGASVRVAAGQCEMAVVSSKETDPGRAHEFTLVILGDEPATLRFETKADTDPRLIHAWASVGTYGDQARERDLLTRVNRRLTQLRGRDWAPLDDRR